LEIQASNLRSFEATLRKLKSDLKIDMVSPQIAASKVSEYEHVLNSTVHAIAESKKEVAVEQFVESKDIDELLFKFNVDGLQDQTTYPASE